MVALFEHLCLAADLMVFYRQSMAVESSYLLFLLAFPFSLSTPSNVQIENPVAGLRFGNARAETVKVLYITEDLNRESITPDFDIFCANYSIDTLESLEGLAQAAVPMDTAL